MSGPLSQLGSALRLVARGLVTRKEPELDPSAPKRRLAVERSGIEISPAAIEEYARATGGEGVAGFRGPDAVAPPFFPATWETALALELFAGMERPLPLGGVIHLSTELLTLRSVGESDAIRSRVELDRVERVSRGLRLTVVARSWTGSGQLCSESTSLFLARSRSPDEGASDRTKPLSGLAPAPEDGWAELVRWSLRRSDGRRYARVSGDYNPIHLWGWTARPFGFRSPILHGYATAARAAHSLIEHRFSGDPTALRRLRVTFRAPLPLPATVRFLVSEEGAERWFRVVGRDDPTVFAEGTYGGAVADVLRVER